MKSLLKKDAPAAIETIDSLKQKVRQIDALAKSGALGPEAAGKARAELEAKLVAAVMSSVVKVPMAAEAAKLAVIGDEAASAKPPTKLLLGLAGLLALFSIVVGSLNGTASRVGTISEDAPVAEASPKTSSDSASPANSDKGSTSQTAALSKEQIAKIVADLEAKAQKDPKNAASWRELGSAQSAAGASGKAAEAYRKALAIEPGNAQTMADLADSSAMASGTLAGEPEKLIGQALKADPLNVKALALAGTMAFDAKQYAKAAEIWDKAVKAAPDSPMAQGLKASSDEARQLASGAALGAASGPLSSAPVAGAKP